MRDSRTASPSMVDQDTGQTVRARSGMIAPHGSRARRAIDFLHNRLFARNLKLTLHIRHNVTGSCVLTFGHDDTSQRLPFFKCRIIMTRFYKDTVVWAASGQGLRPVAALQSQLVQNYRLIYFPKLGIRAPRCGTLRYVRQVVCHAFLPDAGGNSTV